MLNLNEEKIKKNWNLGTLLEEFCWICYAIFNNNKYFCSNVTKKQFGLCVIQNQDVFLKIDHFSPGQFYCIIILSNQKSTQNICVKSLLSIKNPLHFIQYWLLKIYLVSESRYRRLLHDHRIRIVIRRRQRRLGLLDQSNISMKNVWFDIFLPFLKPCYQSWRKRAVEVEQEVETAGYHRL